MIIQKEESCNLNIEYFDKHTSAIYEYKQQGYSLIGVDPGQTNLLFLHENNKHGLKYTLAQYRHECLWKKYGPRLVEFEKDLNQYLSAYIDTTNIVRKHAQRSFRKFIINIKKTFGEKIILCIGDSGYNNINKEMVNMLSKEFICYLVDEYNTSKKCSKCFHNVKNMESNGKILLRVVVCENPTCKTILNRDGNACANIINKVSGKKKNYSNTFIPTPSF